MIKTYIIEGYTKKGPSKAYKIIVYAENAKEARAYADASWKEHFPDRHLFGASVRRYNLKSCEKCMDGLWMKTGEYINGHWVDYV